MVGDSDVDDAPAVVRGDDEEEQQPEGGRGHDEEIRRRDLVRMIGEERPPCVRRPWLMPAHVLRDRGLTQRHTQLLELAVNPRCTPERIRRRHLPNQGADVGRDGRTTGAASSLPGPEQAKAAPMPREHGFRPDDGQGPNARRPMSATARPRAPGPLWSDTDVGGGSASRSRVSAEERECRGAEPRAIEATTAASRAAKRRWIRVGAYSRRPITSIDITRTAFLVATMGPHRPGACCRLWADRGKTPRPPRSSPGIMLLRFTSRSSAYLSCADAAWQRGSSKCELPSCARRASFGSAIAPQRARLITRLRQCTPIDPHGQCHAIPGAPLRTLIGLVHERHRRYTV